MQKEYFEILLESIDSKFQLTMEAFQSLDQKIDRKVDELRTELKQDIAVVDAKVMGLSKRVDQVEVSLSERIDQVEERLSGEITEVRNDLAEHRSNTEMHATPKKRTLKKAA